MDWVAIFEAVIPNGIIAALVAWGGILIWRWQQRHKRRMEVVEHCRVAFERAAQALQSIRSAVGHTGEEAEVVIPEGFTGDEKLYRRYGVFMVRARKVEDQFIKLAEARFLALVHLGKKAADAMDVPFEIRHSVLVDASMLMDWDANDGDAENRKVYREMRTNLYAISQSREKPSKYDKLTPKLWDARDILIAECSRYLGKVETR